MDRSVLARKPMTELKDIASHLQMRGYQKLRKAELIDAIMGSASGPSPERLPSTEEPEPQDTARKVLPPPGPVEDRAPEEQPGRSRTRTRDGSRQRPERDGPRQRPERGDGGHGARPPAEDGVERDDVAAAPDLPAAGAQAPDDSTTGPRTTGDGAGESQPADATGEAPSAAADAEDDEAGRKRRSRRDRRKRNRERSETTADSVDGNDRGPAEPGGQGQGGQGQGGQGQGGQGQGGRGQSGRGQGGREQGGQTGGQQGSPQKDGQQGNEPGEVRAGVLDILPEGYGFLRTTGYLPGERDVYVSQGQIRKHALRRGDVVQGPIRQQRSNEKVPALHHVQKVNGGDLVSGRVAERVDFRDLVPVYPTEPLWLETEGGSVALRAIDLLAPLGKGQRALVVAPPAAGRTDLLKAIGQAVSENYPDAHLMVVLIDERPEDVTDVERAIPGEVISSTFDHPVEDHAQVAELAIERAKRLVELGHDVVVLVDSITRLARAYAGASVGAASLHQAKRLFGAARNIEDGGSLTVIAATLTGSGSRQDELVLEEFLGTCNAVIVLDGEVPPHHRPAISIEGSGTRREELLVDDEDLQVVWAARRRLAGLPRGEATISFAEALGRTDGNEAFLAAAATADAP